eukprot:706144-Prymnesium_polylepis.1
MHVFELSVRQGVGKAVFARPAPRPLAGLRAAEYRSNSPICKPTEPCFAGCCASESYLQPIPCVSHVCLPLDACCLPAHPLCSHEYVLSKMCACLLTRVSPSRSSMARASRKSQNRWAVRRPVPTGHFELSASKVTTRCSARPT